MGLIPYKEKEGRVGVEIKCLAQIYTLFNDIYFHTYPLSHVINRATDKSYNLQFQSCYIVSRQ